MLANQRVLVEQKGPALKNVRGSLIASSLRTLRECGHFEHYLTLLPREHHERIQFALASSWLPLELAEAHYEACDKLALSEPSLLSIGESVGKSIMDTFLGSVTRAGRSMGAVSPWLPLSQYHRISERVFDGGTFIVIETGPKDAIIDTRGLPLLRFHYFRVAMLGVFRATIAVFSKTCYARELPSSSKRDQMVVSLRWV